ncbi:phenylacetate--CoA ligase family protein [Caminibacter sp.]
MIFSKIESAKREDIEKVQLKRLKEVVNRVYHLSPFYREKFNALGIKPDDIKTLKDIEKLPFTKKQDLRNNYPFGLLTVPMDEIVRIHSSSGTTGKPTVVAYTEHDMDVWDEVMMRCLSMGDVNSKDVCHNAYGYGLFTGGLGFHRAAEKLKAAIVPASGGFTDRQLMLMRDFGATVLFATPTFALHLAEVARKEGRDFRKNYKLRAGFFGAEPTSEGLKKEVAQAWDIEYYEVYGLSEIIGPGVSCSCNKGRGLHIQEDHFYPEIIDPETGEVLPDGKEGELVLTTLTKQALPIIRYRTGDITKLYREPCACGRTFVRMESVMGRADDMLIINGVNVFPSQIEHVIANTEGVSLNYQIIVDKKGYLDKLEIMVEVDENIMIDNVGEIERIKKELQNALLNNLYINSIITLVEPKTIERSMGKAKRIIDKRNLK